MKASKLSVEFSFSRYGLGLGLRMATGGTGCACVVGGCPGILEVEAACDAVDVNDLAGEVEAGADFALHGFHVDVAQLNAAAGDELFFVCAFAVDGKLGVS
jgi:hypothetical protein